MDLPVLWFVLIAVLWTGYLLLEGFDFGVGMLLPVLGRGEAQRRTMVRTIGPHWDGNEVWLLTAGGATFAAFPEWYATMFSGMYVPLFLILLALIIRVCAIEWRGKIDSQRWRDRLDAMHTVGSWIPAILWGVAFANLVQGMEIEVIDGRHQLTGGFFSLLTPFTILGGLVTMSVFLAHGATFLALKTTGDLHERSRRLAIPLSAGAIVVGGVWLVWAQLAHSNNGWTVVPLVVAALGLLLGQVALRADREGIAFAGHAAAIVAVVVFMFGAMVPYVMKSSLNEEWSLSIERAASSDAALAVMSVVALIFVPIVLAYTAWSYWVFRSRVTTPENVEPLGLHPDLIRRWERTSAVAGGRSADPDRSPDTH